MRVICLFSGGKDSAYAVQWAMQQGHEVVLLNVQPEPYSMMFHHQNVQWTKLQAEALGLKFHSIAVTEQNWSDLLEKKLRELKAEAIATGAVASNYQKTRVDAMAAKLGIPSYVPLWQAGPDKLKEMLDTMEVYFTGVSAEGMGPELLGKRVTSSFKHPKYVHLFFEGGEAETFVADAP
ncbi:MAG: diphthine--ammonia ligase, partial [Candidatus Micrarchaeota archaeon]